MCLAIPMKVISAEAHFALCTGRSGVERLDTLLTGPLEPGQWVLGFMGSAREIIDETWASQVNSALDAMESLDQGETDVEGLLQTHFGDLMKREHPLPNGL